MEQSSYEVDMEPEPLPVIPCILPALLSEHLMNNELLSPEQTDQIVTAVVLLLWYKDTESAQSIASTFKVDPMNAYEESTEVFLKLKSQALAAPEYGIRETVFLFLDIPGATKEACKAIWEPYFNFAFDVLGIPVSEQRRAFFSGLGFRKFLLCIVAYGIDRNKSFCVHEYNHLRYPGFTGHPFFDEVMTEALAYQECRYFNATTLELASEDTLKAANVNIDYYDHLALFVHVCRKYPDLFALVEHIYTSGDMSQIPQIEALIGTETFTLLESANPDEYDPKLGKNQKYLSATDALERLSF